MYRHAPLQSPEEGPAALLGAGGGGAPGGTCQGVAGFGVRVSLKDEPRTARIPVVALTSFAMKGDRERFLTEGFVGYLEKPISVKEVPDQVRGYCAGLEAG